MNISDCLPYAKKGGAVGQKKTRGKTDFSFDDSVIRQATSSAGTPRQARLDKTDWTRSCTAAQEACGALSADRGGVTLEEYKQAVGGWLDSLAVPPEKPETEITVIISDKAFQKMLEDPAYEKSILEALARDITAPVLLGRGPSHEVYEVGDDLTYRASSWGGGKEDTPPPPREKTAWERRLERHRQNQKEIEAIRMKRSLDERLRAAGKDEKQHGVSAEYLLHILGGEPHSHL